MITFEYNGKIYTPSNLEKKLKKLGITMSDIKILNDTDTQEQTVKEELTYQQANGIILNIWKNQKNGSVCVSVQEKDIQKERGDEWELLGSTRNLETGEIERIDEAEKRLKLI